ncbi:hypothetical protein GUJ93_ZPchr0006g43443 [Zizania palustris]|uniref:Uncharacterized protein n=1 Tax=Zizania palustris TaxID=103762 RepID=A0A8J5VIC2_ZIZPA|nr:hypothetical protein GUJ93_ZPchr0006g43443 [Zizania palustris]
MRPAAMRSREVGAGRDGWMGLRGATRNVAEQEMGGVEINPGKRTGHWRRVERHSPRLCPLGPARKIRPPRGQRRQNCTAVIATPPNLGWPRWAPASTQAKQPVKLTVSFRFPGRKKKHFVRVRSYPHLVGTACNN